MFKVVVVQVEVQGPGASCEVKSGLRRMRVPETSLYGGHQ